MSCGRLFVPTRVHAGFRHSHGLDGKTGWRNRRLGPCERDGWMEHRGAHEDGSTAIGLIRNGKRMEASASSCPAPRPFSPHWQSNSWTLPHLRHFCFSRPQPSQKRRVGKDRNPVLEPHATVFSAASAIHQHARERQRRYACFSKLHGQALGTMKMQDGPENSITRKPAAPATFCML